MANVALWSCAICTFLCIAIFLCLFFLIPRDPDVWLKDVYIEGENDDGSDRFAGKFGFDNNNFWSVKWHDPRIKLYWLPDSGQSISQSCSGSEDNAKKACEFYYSGWCCIRLGTFESDEKWTTDSRETVTKEFYLTQNEQQGACARQMNGVAAVGGDQRMLSKGGVKAEYSLYAGTVTENVDEKFYYWG